MALKTVVVAYDIADDGRRSWLAAALQAFGDRVQKSVFVLMVTEEDLQELKARVLERLDTGVDSVYFVPQCSTCWGGVETIGQAHLPEADLLWFVL